MQESERGKERKTSAKEGELGIRRLTLHHPSGQSVNYEDIKVREAALAFRLVRQLQRSPSCPPPQASVSPHVREGCRMTSGLVRLSVSLCRTPGS